MMQRHNNYDSKIQVLAIIVFILAISFQQQQQQYHFCLASSSSVANSNNDVIYETNVDNFNADSDNEQNQNRLLAENDDNNVFIRSSSSLVSSSSSSNLRRSSTTSSSTKTSTKALPQQVKKPYNIILDLPGIPTIDKAMFQFAGNKWSTIITKDVGDISTKFLNSYPAPKPCKYPTVIDDLYICGIYTNLDGKNNIVGYGGPTFLRTDIKSGLNIPITGVMRFDVVDIPILRSVKQLKSVILHEMGHVLGIGGITTVWPQKSQAPNSKCPIYTGTNANREYKKLSNCNSVPRECTTGHFQEKCLQAELMTPILNPNIDNPISRISIGALQDLGYSVNYTKADKYTSTSINPLCRCKTKTKRSTTTKQKSNKRIRQLQSSDTNTYTNNTIDELDNEDNDEMYDMINHEHHEHNHKERKLSNELHQLAVSHGKKYLQQQRKEYKQLLQGITRSSFTNNTTGSTSTTTIDPTITFIGGDIVSVLVIDNEQHIHEIIVRKDNTDTDTDDDESD